MNAVLLCLAHQARLQPDVCVAHFALDLGTWHQRGHRIDHYDVNCTAAYQRLGNLECLLASVGLRNVQVIHVHPTARGVGRVKRMLHVHKGGNAAAFLRLGDDVLAQGCLAG
jgi:hypothetical protein